MKKFEDSVATVTNVSLSRKEKGVSKLPLLAPW